MKEAGTGRDGPIDGLKQKELMYRILRLNLIPAPRVITPGPATSFPVVFERASGIQEEVFSLEECRWILARSLSIDPVLVPKNSPLEILSNLPKEAAVGFFRESIPYLETIDVIVNGLDAEPLSMPRIDGSVPSMSAVRALAVRAAYCLGLDRARVRLGLGLEGPFVLDTTGIPVQESKHAPACDSALQSSSPVERFRLSCMTVEYIRVDPRTGLTGLSQPKFRSVSFSPESPVMFSVRSGRVESFSFPVQDALGSTEIWLSSPMPREDMPLATRFFFEGLPSPRFLRLLDASLGLLGMLLSPVLEVRERNATGEGLLGNYALSRQGFQYLVVPSLLGQPEALNGLLTLAGVLASHIDLADKVSGPWRPGIGHRGFPDKPQNRPDLEGVYRWQRAFYHAQKGYFRQDVSLLEEILRSVPLSDKEATNLDVLFDLVHLCISSASFGDRDAVSAGPEDFRPKWGIAPPSVEIPSLIVDETFLPRFLAGCENAGCILNTRLSTGENACNPGSLLVLAGGRKVPIGISDVVDEEGQPVFGEVTVPVDGRVDAAPRWPVRYPRGAGEISVRLSPALARRLCLPSDLRYRAEVSGKTIRIGPIVGIMSKPGKTGERFGVETDRFRRMIELGESLGIPVYVFFPGDEVDIEEPGKSRERRTTVREPTKTVTGWAYREERGWYRRDFPRPDVIYDRYIMPSDLRTERGLEPSPPGRPEKPRDLPVTDKREVDEGVIDDARYINSAAFNLLCRDKFEAYRVLARDPLCAQYLPETHQAVDPEEALKFLLKKGRVFFKLRGGTGSQGLFLVEAKAQESEKELQVYVQYKQKESFLCQTLQGRDSILRFLESLIVGEPTQDPNGGSAGSGIRGQEYIMQEAIDLARCVVDEASSATPRRESQAEKSGVFEIRVVCQKGGAGKWQRTGMVCRVNPGPEVFMVPGKEVHLKVDDVLGRVFPGRVREIKEEIRSLARRVPIILEEASGPGGEVSIDLGIDTQGRLRIIEVNSKPATLFRDIGAFRLRRLSMLRILNYAAHLFSLR